MCVKNSYKCDTKVVALYDSPVTYFTCDIMMIRAAAEVNALVIGIGIKSTMNPVVFFKEIKY